MDLSSINKKPSGHAKRKKKKEKEEKEATAIKNVMPINSFFKKARIEEEGFELASSNVSLEVPSTSDAQPELTAATILTGENEAASMNEEQAEQGNSSISEDPALWGSLTESTRKEILFKGISAFQNRAAKYPASRRGNEAEGKTRSLTNDALTRRIYNGEAIPREWIIYSPSTGDIFCFPCKVFSQCNNAFIAGFSDWKHPERITEHEMSGEHRRCMLSLAHRSKHLGTVDASLGRQIEAEGQYWKDVLRRVVAVIKFLSERGLPFRGDDELLGSPHNGNYLGILELLAQFDPFLKEHLQKYGQKGRGKPSYLSSTICEEFINLMGEKTKQAIATELQQAKYFSVIVDSTPDMSHVDQLTFVFRFVSETGKVVERFIGFEPIHSHTGSSLAECVIKMVSDLGLDLSNCRGQAYDNASNMSGKYNGLQAQLKKNNPLMHYIPCAAHSLNLVGVNSVENSCRGASQFFDFLQSLYAFCSASTHRWNKVFTADISLTLKSLSCTRWSCRGDSTRALSENYAKIASSLQMVASDDEERRDTRREAAALCNKLEKLETALMTMFWDTVLQRFKLTSNSLQKREMDLMTAVRLLESLHTYVASLRGQFGYFETSARAITGVTQAYQSETHRVSKRKTFDDETVDNEVVLTGSKKFQVETFNVIIDSLLSGLKKRLDAYKDINDRFGVLFDMDCADTDLFKRANALSSSYPSDLDNSLSDELIQFRSFVSTEQDKTPANLLQIVQRNGLQTTFPNVFVALRLFLTLPVSNCEGERSFSQLKRIKNELRTTMGQKRLSALSLMAIESELVRELDFEDLICNFAKKKTRKKNF
uniref:TTF-type domain-containing protein n=1 Tax=Gouania willdenowi TaxID=441366 RepID=A0A8C5GFL1_GOUWI